MYLPLPTSVVSIILRLPLAPSRFIRIGLESHGFHAGSALRHHGRALVVAGTSTSTSSPSLLGPLKVAVFTVLTVGSVGDDVDDDCREGCEEGNQRQGKYGFIEVASPAGRLQAAEEEDLAARGVLCQRGEADGPATQDDQVDQDLEAEAVEADAAEDGHDEDFEDGDVRGDVEHVVEPRWGPEIGPVGVVDDLEDERVLLVRELDLHVVDCRGDWDRAEKLDDASQPPEASGGHLASGSGPALGLGSGA